LNAAAIRRAFRTVNHSEVVGVVIAIWGGFSSPRRVEVRPPPRAGLGGVAGVGEAVSITTER
jgi:hypothetical protein